MSTFKEFINEDKETAKLVRKIIKDELGLKPKDVSVTTRNGGYSSAVNVKIKTKNALVLKNKIDNLSSYYEKYTRDKATGEILSGGNTFIFTDIDWDLRQELVKVIQDEYEKEIQKTNKEEVSIFKKFDIRKIDDDTYIIRIKGTQSFREVDNKEYIGSALINLIDVNGDSLLYGYIR